MSKTTDIYISLKDTPIGKAGTKYYYNSEFDYYFEVGYKPKTKIEGTRELTYFDGWSVGVIKNNPDWFQEYKPPVEEPEEKKPHSAEYILKRGIEMDYKAYYGFAMRGDPFKDMRKFFVLHAMHEYARQNSIGFSTWITCFENLIQAKKFHNCTLDELYDKYLETLPKNDINWDK